MPSTGLCRAGGRIAGGQGVPRHADRHNRDPAFRGAPFHDGAGREQEMDDRAVRVRVSGPLAQHAEGFRVMLDGRGYAASSAAGQLQVMAHLSRWLAEQDRSAADVTPAAVEQFLLARKGAGCRRWLSRRPVDPWLEYLEAAGPVGPAAAPGPPAPGRAVLARFRE